VRRHSPQLNDAKKKQKIVAARNPRVRVLRSLRTVYDRYLIRPPPYTRLVIGPSRRQFFPAIRLSLPVESATRFEALNGLFPR